MHYLPYLELICCSMSSSNCCFLTCIQISQEAGQVVWYSHLLKNFPQFAVIHIPIHYVSIYLWTGTPCVIYFLLRLIVKNVWKTLTQRIASRRGFERKVIIWFEKIRGFWVFSKAPHPHYPALSFRAWHTHSHTWSICWHLQLHGWPLTSPSHPKLQQHQTVCHLGNKPSFLIPTGFCSCISSI